MQHKQRKYFLQSFAHLQFAAWISRFRLKSHRILPLETLSLIRVDGGGEGAALLVASVKFWVEGGDEEAQIFVTLFAVFELFNQVFENGW